MTLAVPVTTFVVSPTGDLRFAMDVIVAVDTDSAGAESM